MPRGPSARRPQDRQRIGLSPDVRYRGQRGCSRHGPPKRGSSMTAVADLKRAHRATWAAGDYAAIAEMIDEAPPRDLLERIPVTPGDDVLDVATGTGNVAIRAAAAGAQVVGIDLTPELFDT